MKIRLNENRSVIVYALIGLLVAGGIISALTLLPELAPSHIPGFPTAKHGTLVLKVSDSLSRNISKLMVAIDLIEARRQALGNATWITVLQAERTFDLIRIKDVTAFLAEAKVPVGNYTTLRIHIKSATATIDGRELALRVPAEAIKLPTQFLIKEGKTTSLIIDLRYDEASVKVAGSLRAILRATVEHQP